MKRFLMGFVWFLLLWFGILFVGGGVAGGLAGASTMNAADGAVAGRTAGEEFGRRYSTLIFLGAAAITVVGTLTGVLPGTRKDR